MKDNFGNRMKKLYMDLDNKEIEPETAKLKLSTAAKELSYARGRYIYNKDKFPKMPDIDFYHEK